MIGRSTTHGLKVDRDLPLVLDEAQNVDERFVVRRPKLKKLESNLMFVSHFVRRQLVIPYRFFCGVPVRAQTINSSEISRSLHVERDPVTFPDFRLRLGAVGRPHVLLGQNGPVALDDRPNPVGHDMRWGWHSALGTKMLLRGVTTAPHNED